MPPGSSATPSASTSARPSKTTKSSGSRPTIHVPCRHLQQQDDGSVRCGGYGYQGRVATPRRPPAPRRLGGDQFKIVEKKRLVTRTLMAPARMLPVLEHDLAPDANPCATAPVPHRRPHPQGRLLPRPAGRHPLHPEADSGSRRCSATGSRPTSARSSGRTMTSSTPRSSRPAATSRRTGYIATCTAGCAPMAGPPSR